MLRSGRYHGQLQPSTQPRMRIMRAEICARARAGSVSGSDRYGEKSGHVRGAAEGSAERDGRDFGAHAHDVRGRGCATFDPQKYSKTRPPCAGRWSRTGKFPKRRVVSRFLEARAAQISVRLDRNSGRNSRTRRCLNFSGFHHFSMSPLPRVPKRMVRRSRL